jgi:restriction endonuclease
MCTPEFTDIGYGNRLTITEGQVENIQIFQQNGLNLNENEVDRKHLDFTTEMEEGTGKTWRVLGDYRGMYKTRFSKHTLLFRQFL